MYTSTTPTPEPWLLPKASMISSHKHHFLARKKQPVTLLIVMGEHKPLVPSLHSEENIVTVKNNHLTNPPQAPILKALCTWVISTGTKYNWSALCNRNGRTIWRKGKQGEGNMWGKEPLKMIKFIICTCLVNLHTFASC